MIVPFARWRPVLSHGGLMSSHLGAVEHVTTNHADPGGFFSNPINEASSHFWIGDTGPYDGALVQYVDTDYASWAQAAGNGQYVSIETSGTVDKPMTRLQVATFGQLYGYLGPRYRWPLALADVVGERGLIWHGAGGDAWGGHPDCPGDLRRAQRPAILAAAKVAPNAPLPPPEVEPMPITSLVSDQVDTLAIDYRGRLVHRWYNKAPRPAGPPPAWQGEILAIGLVPLARLEGPYAFNGQEHFFGPNADGGQAHVFWTGTAWASDTQPAQP